MDSALYRLSTLVVALPLLRRVLQALEIVPNQACHIQRNNDITTRSSNPHNNNPPSDATQNFSVHQALLLSGFSAFLLSVEAVLLPAPVLLRLRSTKLLPLYALARLAVGVAVAQWTARPGTVNHVFALYSLAEKRTQMVLAAIATPIVNDDDVDGGGHEMVKAVTVTPTQQDGHHPVSPDLQNNKAFTTLSKPAHVGNLSNEQEKHVAHLIQCNVQSSPVQHVQTPDTAIASQEPYTVDAESKDLLIRGAATISSPLMGDSMPRSEDEICDDHAAHAGSSIVGSDEESSCSDAASPVSTSTTEFMFAGVEDIKSTIPTSPMSEKNTVMIQNTLPMSRNGVSAEEPGTSQKEGPLLGEPTQLQDIPTTSELSLQSKSVEQFSEACLKENQIPNLDQNNGDDIFPNSTAEFLLSSCSERTDHRNCEPDVEPFVLIDEVLNKSVPVNSNEHHLNTFDPLQAQESNDEADEAKLRKAASLHQNALKMPHSSHGGRIEIVNPLKSKVRAQFLQNADNLSVAAKARALDAWTETQPKFRDAPQFIDDEPSVKLQAVRSFHFETPEPDDSENSIVGSRDEQADYIVRPSKTAVHASFLKAEDSTSSSEQKKLSVMEKARALQAYVEEQPKFRPAKTTSRS